MEHDNSKFTDIKTNNNNNLNHIKINNYFIKESFPNDYRCIYKKIKEAIIIMFDKNKKELDATKINAYIDNVKEYCETKLNIKDPLEIIKIFRYIALIQAKRGIPNEKTLKCFLDELKKYHEEIIQTNQKTQITHLLRFINHKRCRKGIPETLDELKKLIQDSKVCLINSDLSKKNEAYMTLKQVNDLSLKENISNNNIKQYNSKLFRTLDRNKKIIGKYLSSLCSIYDYVPQGSNKNKIISDIVIKIATNPDIIKTSDIFNQEIKDDIINAAILAHACRNTIIQINDILVIHYANSIFYQSCSNNLSVLKDLKQTGRLTLTKCVDLYDPSYDCEFSTFAVTAIRRTIASQYLKEEDYLNYSLPTKKMISRVLNIRTEQGTSMTIKEIAKKFHSNEIVIRRYITSHNQAVHLSQMVSSKDEGGNGSDIISDSNQDPAKISAAKEIQNKKNKLLPILLTTLLDELSDRERDILFLRCDFYNKGKIATFSEIGQKYSLTRERIRKIHDNTLKKLKSKLIKHPNLLKAVKELFFDGDNFII